MAVRAVAVQESAAAMRAGEVRSRGVEGAPSEGWALACAPSHAEARSASGDPSSSLAHARTVRRPLLATPCQGGHAKKVRSILLRLLAGVRGGAHRASAGAASRHHRGQASSASARADQSWVDQIHREEQDETSDPATAGRRGRGTSRGRHQAQVRRSARRGAISRLLPSRSRGRARTDRCV